jgi:cyanophycinase
MVKLLQSWECMAEGMMVAGRAEAQSDEPSVQVDAATGVMLLGQDPLRLAATLGGTRLAQTIRRANARSKTVAGMEGAATFLCQHLLAPTTTTATPATLRMLANFAPGLGLVNRLVVDGSPTLAGQEMRLLAAVAVNPFLIGVGLEVNSTAILYPDNTLQIYGEQPALLVDGATISEVDLELEPVTQDAVGGILCHRLTAGHTFNLDDRKLAAPVPGSRPDHPITSAF